MDVRSYLAISLLTVLRVLCLGSL